VAIVLILIGLKKWAQIPRNYFVGGFIVWAGLVVGTNLHHSIREIGLIIIEQFNGLGILSLIASAILLSAAIPRLLFQLGDSNQYQQSRRNWLILFGFSLSNLILTYGKEFLGWDITFAIPGLIFSQIAWIAYSFQVDWMNSWLRWGINLLSLSTLLYFQISGNDPGINAFVHGSLICQSVMLFLFPLFIISNFKTPIQQHLPVYKIIHKAPHVDLRLMYLGVFILGSAWVYAKNASVIHQFQAAFYNERGDMESQAENRKSAEFAYQQAMLHSKLNAKSNLSLAALALQANDYETAAYYLATSLQKHASESAYLALANIYLNNDHAFEALFMLQKAQQQFPESLEILTSLAKQFESLKSIDSANYYYQKAYKLHPNNSISQGNMLYSAKMPIENNEDTDPAVAANNLAIALKSKKSVQIPAPETTQNPGLDLRQWAYVYNYQLYAKNQSPEYPISQWVKNPLTAAAFPEYNLIEAWQAYHHGKPLTALQKLDLLIKRDTTATGTGLKSMLDFWKTSLLKPQATQPLTTLQMAQNALRQYPFQVDVLQQALPLLNKNKQEKAGYDAALAALQWNEGVPVYYLIFAMQAYQIGEITYGNEAVQELKKRNPTIYLANQAILGKALQEAIRRQNF
jgi:Tfp pilus assembly protein PilF